MVSQRLELKVLDISEPKPTRKCNVLFKISVLGILNPLICNHHPEYSPHTIHYNHNSLKTVLITHCTHYTLSLLHTVLATHCNPYTPYSLHTVVTADFTQYTLYRVQSVSWPLRMPQPGARS